MTELDLIVLRELAWHAQNCASSIRKRSGSEKAALAYEKAAKKLWDKINAE